jgi:hypothetical protein
MLSVMLVPGLVLVGECSRAWVSEGRSVAHF